MTTPYWPLFGHERAQEAFLAAWASGRFHHAWLIEGPSGIGKATLARRLAALMLGADGADAPLSDPVSQKVAADSHPDLRWISRRPDEKGKLKQDIPVSDVRELIGFFGLRSALGGWRVGVIDAIDELNRSGANALLKTLEEPPGRCALLLVSHGARPVLPTIRSRCRTLRLDRLSPDETARALAAAGVDDDTREQAKELARGRPGRALELATPNGLAAAAAARRYMQALPKVQDATLAEFIERLGADEAAFEAGVAELLARLEGGAWEEPDRARVWLDVSSLAAQTSGLNLDRAEAAAKIAASVRAFM